MDTFQRASNSYTLLLQDILFNYLPQLALCTNQLCPPTSHPPCSGSHDSINPYANVDSPLNINTHPPTLPTNIDSLRNFIRIRIKTESF